MDAFLRAFGESLLLGLFFHHISSALRVFCWLCKFCVFCIFCIFLVLVPGLLRKALWLLVGLSLNWYGVVRLLVGMVWYGVVWFLVWYGAVWLLGVSVYCLSLNSNVSWLPYCLSSVAPQTHLGPEFHLALLVEYHFIYFVCFSYTSYTWIVQFNE